MVENCLRPALAWPGPLPGQPAQETRELQCCSRETPQAASPLCSLSWWCASINSPYQFAVPLSRTDCVPAPSCTTMVALFGPVLFEAVGATPGANLTLIVQLAPIAMLGVQLLV